MTPARLRTLAEAAAESGARWAKTEREALHAEGRRAEGGWPGTLSQARNRVSGAVARLAAPLSYEEAAWLARTIYDCARREWLADRDPPLDASAAGGAAHREEEWVAE